MKLSTIIVFGLVILLGIYYYMRNTKTIYLVWRNLRPGGRSNGFGDKIRSAISTYQYCKDNSIRLVVDGTEDICGRFLKHVNSNEVLQDKDVTVIECPNSAEDCHFEEQLNRMFKHTNSLYIYTNKCPKNDDCITYKPNILSKQDKEFAKYLCEPQDFLRLDVEKTIQSLPVNYGIQHFRFLDTVFDKDIDERDPIFMKYFSISTYTRVD